MNDDDKKVSSYSLLQLRLGEVQKTKKVVPSKPKENSKTSEMKKAATTTPAKPVPEKKVSKPKPEETNPDVPDRSYGDFYCKICDSHMNSDNMWEAHITGKKHIKNVKKGDTDSKYDDLDVESDVKNILKDIKEPIVGLSYIHEIRRREPGVPPMYNCFLCHASIATVPLVKEHVCSLKHRLNYVKEASPEEFELLNATNLKKASLEPLVIETAAKLENEFGRGIVKVKQVKAKAAPTATYKRSYDSDDDHDSKPSKSQKSDPSKNPHLWKSVDISKRYDDSDISIINIFDKKRSSFLDSKRYSPMEEIRRHSFRRGSRSRSLSPDPYYKKGEYSRRYESDKYDFRSDMDRHGRSDIDRHSRSDIDRHSRSDIDRHSRSAMDRPSRSDMDRPSRSDMDRPSRADMERHSRSDMDTRLARRTPLDFDLYSRKDTSDYAHRNTAADIITKHYQDKSSLPSERKQSSYDVPLPGESSSSKTDINFNDIYRHLMEAVNNFPTDSFLAFVLRKLDTIELMDLHQLTLLTKICNKAQTLICSKFPPEVQAILKQKLQNSEMGTKIASTSVTENKNLRDFYPQSSLSQNPANLNPYNSQSSIPSVGNSFNTGSSGSSSSITNRINDLIFGSRMKSNSPVTSSQQQSFSQGMPSTSSLITNQQLNFGSRIQSAPSVTSNQQQNFGSRMQPNLSVTSNQQQNFGSRMQPNLSVTPNLQQNFPPGMQPTSSVATNQQTPSTYQASQSQVAYPNQGFAPPSFPKLPEKGDIPGLTLPENNNYPPRNPWSAGTDQNNYYRY